MVSPFQIEYNYNQRRKILQTYPGRYWGTAQFSELSFEIWTMITGVSLRDPQGFVGGVTADTGLFIFAFNEAQSLSDTVLPNSGDYIRICDPIDFASVTEVDPPYLNRIAGSEFSDIPLWTVTRDSNLNVTRSDLYGYNSSTRGWTTLLASTTGGYDTPWEYLADVSSGYGVGTPYRTSEILQDYTDVDTATSAASAIRSSINAYVRLYNDMMNAGYSTQNGNYYAYSDESGEIGG